jgi:2'-5' RNA ligase
MAKAAIKLSKEISQKYEVFFVLDGINFYPHITIYSPEYPEDNLDKVLNAVEETTKDIEKIKFVFKKIKPHQGFIVIYFELSLEIKKIHEEIVLKLSPLREGRIRDKYKADDFKMTFSPKEQKYIAKYGYANAMELYDPHSTTIRLKDELLAEKVAENLEWDIPEFIIDKIGIYRTGGHGTCIELVKEFSLKTG